MSRSALYTVNSSTQALTDGSLLNLGSIIRRFGCNCNLSGNAIRIQGEGYYTVDASIIIAPTAAATTLTLTLLKDGVAVPGGIARTAVTTAGNPVTVPIAAMIKENCACCDDASNLTIALTGGAATVTNVAVVTEKI